MIYPMMFPCSPIASHSSCLARICLLSLHLLQHNQWNRGQWWTIVFVVSTFHNLVQHSEKERERERAKVWERKWESKSNRARSFFAKGCIARRIEVEGLTWWQIWVECQVCNFLGYHLASKVMFKVGKLFGLPIEALRKQNFIFKKQARYKLDWFA